MHITNAVIFAGGKSSRMGRDKALLPFGGYKSMAEFQYQKLSKLFQHVHISAKENKFDFEVSVIMDNYEQSSPMVALASTLDFIKDDAVFILSVDMPLINESIISTLLSHYNSFTIKPDIVICKSNRGLEPLCGIYSKNILPKTKELISNDIHKMKELFDRVKTEILYFPKKELFANLNTPTEYQSIQPLV